MTDPPSHYRTERLTVRLTPAERREVEARARESGRPPSTLLRDAVLGAEIHARPSRVAREIVYHLAKIGANLNQLAHHANASGKLATTARLHRLLDQLYATIRQLRDERQ